MFSGKKILITGGTGSVGQELVRQLLSVDPAVIRILSRDEYKQFEMERDFGSHPNLRFLLGDVRDKERLSYAAKDIDLIFHLAALKQVPACEYDPFEAVQTNVIGSQNVIKVALENQVKRVLFTSSDKAINPTNTMGASKLIAEKLFVSANYYKGSNSTIFTSVRFGNVIGSRGSVIPLFFDQIMKDRKISITNPDMYRFMMSLSEACQLVLKAMTEAKGGEIFVLKMPVVRLGDLLDAVLEIAEEKLFVKKQEIKIEQIGLRLGEKMVEELMSEEEAYFAQESDTMFVISQRDSNKQKNGKQIPVGQYRADAPQGNKLSVKEIKAMILKEHGTEGAGR